MSNVDQVVAVLRSGGLVAFPTETVYGLGADATNAEAVAKIFAAKGRPATNPLIVHVADAAVARRYAAEWPPAASQLAEAFWPGPLTLVLPKTAEVVRAVTAGGETVGLRVPAHPMALQLLQSFGGPVAAPSANRSNHVSPTTAQHVRDDLGDAVDLVLDGGPCGVGIESTVLDLTAGRPVILRLGGVSRSQIERIIGPVDIFAGSAGPGQSAASPGQQERHYAPQTPAFRFDTEDIDSLKAWLSRADVNVVSVFFFDAMPCDWELEEDPRLRYAETLPEFPAEYARVFYAVLRHHDTLRRDAIVIEMPPDRPEWAAVRDRITRATQSLPCN